MRKRLDTRSVDEAMARLNAGAPLRVRHLMAIFDCSKWSIYRMKALRFVETEAGRVYEADDVRLYMALRASKPKLKKAS